MRDGPSGFPEAHIAISSKFLDPGVWSVKQSISLYCFIVHANDVGIYFLFVMVGHAPSITNAQYCGKHQDDSLSTTASGVQ